MIITTATSLVIKQLPRCDYIRICAKTNGLSSSGNVCFSVFEQIAANATDAINFTNGQAHFTIHYATILNIMQQIIQPIEHPHRKQHQFEAHFQGSIEITILFCNLQFAICNLQSTICNNSYDNNNVNVDADNNDNNKHAVCARFSCGSTQTATSKQDH